MYPINVPFTTGRLVDVDQVGQPVHGLLVHELDVLLWELGLRRLSCKKKLNADHDTFFVVEKTVRLKYVHRATMF